MRRILGSFLVLFLVLSGIALAQLEITAINVGQGNSFFIKTPNNLKILVDAGTVLDTPHAAERSNAYNNLLQVLNDNGISKENPLDYIIVTHYHLDHYGFIDNVINRFGLPRYAVLDRGGTKKWGSIDISDIPAEYMAAVSSKRNPNGVLAPGAKIDLGSGAYLQLLAIGYPDESGAPDKRVKVWGLADVNLEWDFENPKSLVFVLRWNGFDMLLGGDCDEEVEPYLGQVLQRENINIDVYQMHHHGSDSSNLADFLDKVMPETAICSVGSSSAYQHPRKEAYDNLYTRCRSFIFQTSEGYNGSKSYVQPPAGYGVLAQGNIMVSYDGNGEYVVKTPSQEYRFKTDEFYRTLSSTTVIASIPLPATTLVGQN